MRVVRLPRHGASCPVAVAVSCSADRQALGKITAEGVFLEQLEEDPARYLPEVTHDDLADDDVVRIDLNRPMDEIRAELTRYPVKTRLSLTGPMVVARDIAHAKIKERLDAGEPMPQYLRDHCVYYAGPAKTPEGYASGSFGPTTAGRMDSYVAEFQAAGGSLVMLAKGNRSRQVTDACAAHGGFYLGSIGGPAARLAQDCIRHVEVLEYPELGMEAVWKIDVEDFPAFIVVDDKGNDFFDLVSTPVSLTEAFVLGQLDEVEVVVAPVVEGALGHQEHPVGLEVAHEGRRRGSRARCCPGHPRRPSATAAREPGSRLLVGSSSSSRLWRPATRMPSASLVFSPPERVPASWCTLSPVRPIAPTMARRSVSAASGTCSRRCSRMRAARLDALVLLGVVAGDDVVAVGDRAGIGRAGRRRGPAAGSSCRRR